MKIAVYTICKNEAQFVKRWLESAKEADYLVVTDTGSLDNTLMLLEGYKNNYPNLIVNSVSITPWRFEDARNFNLLSIPDDADVCICLDMDEILLPDWRVLVEKAFSENPWIDRLRYNYVWSWNEDCSPGVTYFADKIHKKFGYRWVNPVHEVLSKDIRLDIEKQFFIPDTLIEHYPDNTKSRSSYLDLLALAVKENPLNDRNAHYYARDLMFAGRYKEAIKEFERHLALPTAMWNSERSASNRYIGDCYWALGQGYKAISYFDKAIQEAPNEREPYVAMAQAHRYYKSWSNVVYYCMKALSIVDKQNSHICQPSAWSNWPNEMLEEAKKEIDNGN